MNSAKYPTRGTIDFGLLIMRIGIGFSFVFLHGLPKLMGGPVRWTLLGRSMNYLGIYFLPEVWGFLATLIELVGGLLLISGLYTRISAFFMTIVMIVATVYHIANGNSIGIVSHPVEIGIFLMGLTVAGPGRISLDYFRHNRMINK